MSITLINQGSRHDNRHLELYTKEHRFIRNEMKLEKLPEMMRAAEENFRQRFPLRQTRSLSAVYNCAGLVFAARRTVVDIDELRMILDDDGYRQVARRADLMLGDIIVYRKAIGQPATHVGIVLKLEPEMIKGDYNVWVLSQWGLDGEYIHREIDVPPAYGTITEFYTERRILT